MSYKRRTTIVWLLIVSALLTAGLTGLLLLGCATPGRAPGSGASVPLDGIREPLARIPVRMAAILEAVPWNPVVKIQTNATNADVNEAREAVTVARADLEAKLAKAAGEAEKLRAQLADAKSDAGKTAAMWLGRIRVLATIGIAAGIALCFLVNKKLIAITLASVVVLIAIAIDGFVWKFGMPIAAGCFSILAIIGLWFLWAHRKASFDLFNSGKILIDKAGGMSPEIAADLNAVQSSVTKRIVNALQATDPTPPGSKP